MATTNGDWSVWANCWRGDRALGGRLSVNGGWLAFSPHGAERALGGDTRFTCALTDITGVTQAPRSWRVWRPRLVVTTATGDSAYFLVNRINRISRRLIGDITAAGRVPNQGDVDESVAPPPELTPDDSPFLNRLNSPWAHLAASLVWAVFLLGVVAGSRSGWAIALLGSLLAFSGWKVRSGFIRSRRIRAARRRDAGHES